MFHPFVVQHCPGQYGTLGIHQCLLAEMSTTSSPVQSGTTNRTRHYSCVPCSFKALKRLLSSTYCRAPSKLGYDVVTRFRSNLTNYGVFYTDSNGKQTMPRA